VVALVIALILLVVIGLIELLGRPPAQAVAEPAGAAAQPAGAEASQPRAPGSKPGPARTPAEADADAGSRNGVAPRGSGR
jgi:hypothetical protein